MGALTGPRDVEVVVIGGGQAGLATGFHLARSPARPSFVILDAEPGPGGAWRHGWDTLHLFSPARWSSLPGRLMPRGAGEYPARDETVAYLAEYERRFALPVERAVRVLAVRRPEAGEAGGGAAARAPLLVETDRGTWRARAVVSATGTWAQPYLPDVPGREAFAGRELHSATYRSPLEFIGQRVAVVGGGNSGAQILAELSEVADTIWATREPPTFLPDDVDGRVLFDEATARYRAHERGEAAPPSRSLGSIVMTTSVRDARERGVLASVPLFTRFTRRGVVWRDGRESAVDAVVWCTGFRPALAHLAPLRLPEVRGRAAVRGTRAAGEPRLWLVGYGDWTGYASATLVGVGRSAKAAVDEISAYLLGRDGAAVAS